MGNELSARINVSKVLDKPRPLSANINTNDLIPEKTSWVAEKSPGTDSGRKNAMTWVFDK